MYFGWCGLKVREYTVYDDSSCELLRSVDVVHKLKKDNITFQCEEEGHYVEDAFVDGIGMRSHINIARCVVGT